MALINDPNITRQIADLAATGTIDTNLLVTLLNSTLPPTQQLQTGVGVVSGVYKRFGEFDKVNAKVEVVTTGLWASDASTVTASFTSSAQAAATTGDYYYNVYSDSALQNLEFAVAYGHIYGSGSAALDNDPDSTLASKAVYAQFKSTLLDPTDDKFSFVNSSGATTDSDDIFVIAVSRSRYREQVDAGNWELKLAGGITLIDDSGQRLGDTFGKAGRVFKVVRGTLLNGITDETSTSGLGFGLFYPDRGIIVLNPAALHNVSAIASLPLDGVDSEKQNHKILWNAIRTGADFDARRTERVNTQHFFVRATNREFNYTNNPSFVDSAGSFVNPTFETDPQTFITTIGLYNDSNELLAVAKTSRPIVKSFDKEVLVKVKLSF
jgi:hypothetical protein